MVVSVASRILFREDAVLARARTAGEDCAWIQARQTMKRETPNRYEHVAHHFFFVLLFLLP